MATSTGPINGTAFAMYLGGVMIGFSTAATLEVTHEPMKTSGAASMGWNSRIGGMRDWSASATGLIAMNGTSGKKYYQIFNSYISSRAKVQIFFKTLPTQDMAFYGYAYCTSISFETAVEDSAMFSCSFIAASELTATESQYLPV